MQIQEMYWKQKYSSLEENYNTLKNKYKEKVNFTKIPTGKFNIFNKNLT